MWADQGLRTPTKKAKKAACILGVWEARNMTGTHAARWLELKNKEQLTTRIFSDGFIDRDTESSQEVRVLSKV